MSNWKRGGFFLFRHLPGFQIFGPDLTVTLTNGDATEIGIPATITILANQSSVTFDVDAVDDALLDETQNVMITVNAMGYVSADDTLDVTDHEMLTITIAGDSIAENAGSQATTATVTRSNTDTGAALTVTLTNGDASEIEIPASVIIPADQASVSFDIDALDDALLDGTQNVTITAWAGGYVEGSDSLEVTDSEDQDGDGVEDYLEDGAPNGGDGNQDGIPDQEQENVVSLPCFTDEGYITLVATEGTQLNDAGAADNPSPVNAPNDVSFPAGFVEFGTDGIAQGAPVVATVHVQTMANTYYKFGPTPDNSTPHWYPFMYDGSTGAKIYSDRVELHFVDGRRGDDDLIANGSIVDFGAPGATDHPWQNPVLPEDVNNQGGVTPLDVLTLISDLNANGPHALPPAPTDLGYLPPYLDVSGDDSLSPLDVLTVIAYINAQVGATSQTQGEGEPSGEQALADQEPTVHTTVPAGPHDMPTMATVSMPASASSEGSFPESASPHVSAENSDREMPHQDVELIASDYTNRGALPRRTGVDTGASLISLETELGLDVDDDLLSLLAEDIAALTK